MRFLKQLALVSLCISALACDDAGELSYHRSRTIGPAGEDWDSTSTTDAEGASCSSQKHYGFAGSDLTENRPTLLPGTNRRRIKPFSALKSEFQRVLGRVPSALESNAAAFGDTPARWFAEPTAGAVSLYTAYTLAFTACYESMSAAPYAQAPTPTSAEAECRQRQKTAWQRDPSPDEVAACTTLVMDLPGETNPRRQWAHGCASVLSSVHFATY